MDKEQADVIIQAITTTGIAIFLILVITNTKLVSSTDAVSFLFNLYDPASSAIAFNAILWGIFFTWAWRMSIFHGWLVKSPYLEGRWTGSIESSFEKTPGSRLPAIPVQVEIKQSFFDLKIIMTSDQMQSMCFAANFYNDGGVSKLCYNYTSRPSIDLRDKSQIHDGTALLTIDGTPPNKLSGEYWTSRKTIGKLNLKKKGYSG